ncbi:MAG: alpha-L-fucosidase [Planctomycetota bacterium]|nr:alpha-L-fucosidase [Planctomycetota bacterium]
MISSLPQLPDPTRAERMAWWREARFGMFIHYGAYAIPGRGEWVMNRERIPFEEYRKFYPRFQPRPGCAEEWARTAAEGGMKYVTLTTRHHDGYCLWDSKLSEHTTVKLGPRRDLVAEYVEALRRHGLRVGLYYSLKDWSHPGWLAKQNGDEAGHAAFLEYVHGQVRELCTNYGKIDVLWYDGPGPYDEKGWRADELNGMARKLQPGLIINCRSHLAEDFDTPENHVAASPPGRAWESNMTLNDNWGWHAGDFNHKSPREVIRLLTRIVHLDGNFMLNIGPEPDGRVPAESAAILRQVGAWMRVHGEAIHGAARTNFQWHHCGWPTEKGNCVYEYLNNYPGTSIVLTGFAAPVRRATLMSTGQELMLGQHGEKLTLWGLPPREPDPLGAVLKIEFEGKPKYGVVPQ